MTIIATSFVPLASGTVAPAPLRWTGNVLGATGSVILFHPDPDRARAIIGRCLDEITRLEKVFSLYDPDSELSRLNRAGGLDAPSLDLWSLLEISLRFGVASDGAFDITVQPLYALYARHFAQRPNDMSGPDDGAILRARAAVDYRGVYVSHNHIHMRHPGAAITLNGIAQGYIADRIGDLLRDAGLRHVLLDLGEVRVLQGQPNGSPWHVGIRHPIQPERVLGQVDLVSQAMATSAGDATRFDKSGRHHHLFDPATGRSAHRYLAVTVIADRATTADALSTAISIMPRDAARKLVSAHGATALVGADANDAMYGMAML